MSEEFSIKLFFLGEEVAPVGMDFCLNLSPISTRMQSGKYLLIKDFPKVNEHYQNHMLLRESNFCCKNISLNPINIKLPKILPRLRHSYTFIVDPSEAVNYLVEFVNSCDPSGLPAHE